MLSIFLSQLSLKPAPISRYDLASTRLVWSIFVALCIASNINMLASGASILALIAMTLITSVSIYTAYKTLFWWLVRQGFWDGKGNLFALIVTSSLVDLLFPIVMYFGLIPVVILGLFSFSIFFQAIRNGFLLSFWQTMGAIGIATIGATVAGMILAALAGIFGLTI